MSRSQPESSMTRSYSYNEPKPLHVNMLASAIGSVNTSFLLCPIEVLRVRIQAMQSQNIHQSYHVWSTLKSIIRNEPLTHFWAGWTTGVVAGAPGTVLAISLYELFKTRMLQMTNNNLIISTLVAGCFSRCLCVALVAPLELIRTRQQTYMINPQGKIPSALSLFRQILEESGPRGFYRGLGTTLVRDAIFSSIYWMANERLKHSLHSYFDQRQLNELATADRHTSTTPHVHVTPSRTWAISLVSGATAGSICAIITQPADIIKTTQQMYIKKSPQSTQIDFKTANALTISKYIVENKGISGLFTGMTPRLAKVSLGCALMLSSYDVVKHWISTANIPKAS